MSGNPATVISEKNFMQEVTIPLVPVSSNRQKRHHPFRGMEDLDHPQKELKAYSQLPNHQPASLFFNQ